MHMQTTELHPKRIEDLNNQPTIKSKMGISEDGKWFIHTTTIVDIKAIGYLDKVLEKEADF